MVGAWTAVNKQISVRYQGADIAPQASIIIFDRFSPSRSLINNRSIEHKKYDVINERE